MALGDPLFRSSSPGLPISAKLGWHRTAALAVFDAYFSFIFFSFFFFFWVGILSWARGFFALTVEGLAPAALYRTAP